MHFLILDFFLCVIFDSLRSNIVLPLIFESSVFYTYIFASSPYISCLLVFFFYIIFGSHQAEIFLPLMFESCVFMNRVISKYSASPHLNLVQAVFYFEFSHVIFGSYRMTHVESSYLGFSTFQHFLHVHIPILNFSCVIFGSHQGEIFFPIMFESYNCVFVSSNIFLLFSVSCILLF